MILLENLGRLTGRLTLYVNRPLKNADQVIAWAKAQGFETCLQPDDMHVTVCFSKTPVDWSKFTPDEGVLLVPEDEGRAVQQFGDATVLTFSSGELEDRHARFAAGGASYDFDQYRPHVTISWNGPAQVSEPYAGPLVFGPEEFETIKDDWKDAIVEEGRP